MPSLKPVTHCIFDMDGLLLDTEFIYEKSIRAICESFDKDYRCDVRLKVMGTTEQNTARTVIDEIGLPLTVTDFLHRLNELVRVEFKHVNLMKGADRLIQHLHESNVKFCLATSSGEEIAKIKMSSHCELFKLFSHYVMGSTDPEVKRGKPAPDIFLVAAARFDDKPDPSKCIVFEDSPNGIRAAIAAGKHVKLLDRFCRYIQSSNHFNALFILKTPGMQAVMVPDKIVGPEKRTEATIVLESLEQFQPELFGLPKFMD